MRLTLWSVYECLKISFLGKCHAGTSVFSPATRRNREEQLVVSVSSDSHHGYVDWNEYHWLKVRALNWWVILSPSCYQQPENEWSDGWAAALLLYRCYLYFMCLIIYILKLGNLFLALIQARGWECGRCVCVCEREIGGREREGTETWPSLSLASGQREHKDGLSQKTGLLLKLRALHTTWARAARISPFRPLACYWLTVTKHTSGCQNSCHHGYKYITRSHMRRHSARPHCRCTSLVGGLCSKLAIFHCVPPHVSCHSTCHHGDELSFPVSHAVVHPLQHTAGEARRRRTSHAMREALYLCHPKQGGKIKALNVVTLLKGLWDAGKWFAKCI